MSLTLAVMCQLYRRHYLEIYDRRFWVKELNSKVQDIRRTLPGRQKNHPQAVPVSSILSRDGWRGSIQRAQVKSQRAKGFLKTGQPPPFWAWLASRGDFLSKSVFSRFQNHYLKERELDRANLSTMIPLLSLRGEYKIKQQPNP